MIRRALVALDGSAVSRVAAEMAFRFVKESHANRKDKTPLLTGVAVLDRPTVTKPQAAPVRGVVLKKERDSALSSESL